jgi:hypothetical protein
MLCSASSCGSNVPIAKESCGSKRGGASTAPDWVARPRYPGDPPMSVQPQAAGRAHRHSLAYAKRRFVLYIEVNILVGQSRFSYGPARGVRCRSSPSAPCQGAVAG